LTKGYTHHADKDEPKYEIKTDNTDHIAMHMAATLRKSLWIDLRNSRAPPSKKHPPVWPLC